MNVALPTLDRNSPLITIALACAAALLATGALLYLSMDASVKVLAALVAAAIFALLGMLSGNVRLFCLWALMLTIPFDLSKRFGTVHMKMGGESSFRAEVSDVFLLVLIAFLLRDLWVGNLSGIRVPKLTYVWVLIMLMGIGWTIVGPWRMTAAHEVARMLKVMILFLVVCNELQRPQRILHCAAGLALGVLVQAVTGLAQYFTGQHFGLELLGETGPMALKMLSASSVQGASVYRVGAFLSHPNVFGAFLAALLPVVIGIFLLRVGKAFKLFALATATLGMAALIVTLSRSGWVSFAIAFFVLIFLMLLHPGLRRRSILAAAAATLALLVVVAIFIEPISSRIFSSRQAAMLGRAEYQRDALGMITAKPWLGFGLNSYVFAVPPFTQYGARGARAHYRDWIPPVHNIYLLWWSETGIIGLILHLTFWGAIVYKGIGNLRVKDETVFMLNAVCMSAMSALVVDGFFSFSLRFNSILRVFWVLAAMILAIHYWRQQPSPGNPFLQQDASPGLPDQPRPVGGGLLCTNPLLH